MSYTDKILLANEKIIYQGKRSVFPKLPYIIGLSLIFPFISVLGTLAVFFLIKIFLILLDYLLVFF